MKRIIFLIVLLSLAVGCTTQQDNTSSISADNPSSVPALNPATVPTEKLANQWWEERHQKVLEDIKSDPALILVGDSILHSLDDPSRKAVWEKYLDQYTTVNMGFSGDRTENVIWRLQNGEIEGINPKVALILIGTNNTDGNHFLSITQPQELSEGIGKICSIIRTELPDTQILLLGVLPYGYTPNYRDVINKETNEIISGFPENDPNIHYRDIGSVFLDTDSRVKESLMPDFLHPNAEGHLLMFETLEDDIAELMGKTVSEQKN